MCLAHMIDDLDLILYWVEQGKNIVCAGLMADSAGRIFKNMARILGPVVAKNLSTVRI